jgi:hypothetical protein
MKVKVKLTVKIAVITLNSSNIKTGDMAMWILNADESPLKL